MRRNYFPRSLVIFACLVLSAFAQLEKIVIPAGTPEDQGLQAISKEEDAQKKATMYEEFVQKFSSNPAAVAYGNWQLSQYHQGAGDLQKSLDYGDKALVSAPHNLDILVSQVGVAQQMKNNAKTMDYSVRGGEAAVGDKQPFYLCHRSTSTAGVAPPHFSLDDNFLCCCSGAAHYHRIPDRHTDLTP